MSGKQRGIGRTALGIVKKYYPQVKSIRDAKNDLVVQVVAADCKKSRSKSPDSCAMAMSLKRIYDGAVISLSTAYIIDGTKAVRFTVPAAVARELISFDRHHDFAIGTYKLNKVPKGRVLGVDGRSRMQKNDLRKDHTSKGVVNHHTAGVRSLL